MATLIALDLNMLFLQEKTKMNSKIMTQKPITGDFLVPSSATVCTCCRCVDTIGFTPLRSGIIYHMSGWLTLVLYLVLVKIGNVSPPRLI